MTNIQELDVHINIKLIKGTFYREVNYIRLLLKKMRVLYFVVYLTECYVGLIMQ